jgi:hypothetical protein
LCLGYINLLYWEKKETEEKKRERDRGKRRRGGEETFEICST